MMEKIIELLKERGFVDKLQHCLDVCSKMYGENEKRHLKASKVTLADYILNLDEKDELSDRFITFATDLAAEAIVKKLDLKPQDCEVSKEEELVVGLITLLNNFKEDK